MELENFYNIDILKKEISKAITAIQMDTNGDYDDFDGGKQYIVETLVSGSYGIYQASCLIDMFGLADKAKEYLYEKAESGRISKNKYDPEVWMWVIEPFLSELADAIESAVELLDGYSIFFGGNENDGAYEMFLYKTCEEEIE